MRVLGLSFSGHGSAICLVEDGRIVAAMNLERLTRVKFALATLPPYAPVITAVLKSAFGLDRPPPLADFYEVFPEMLKSVCGRVGSREAEIDLVVKTHDNIQPDPENPRPYEEFCDYFAGTKTLFDLEHHLCHAYQAYLCSPFEDAAILTIDGRGENLERLGGRAISTSMADGQGDRVQVLAEVLWPASVGGMYSTATLHLGFREEQEGNTMALAAFGTDRFYRAAREDAFDLHDDGTFELRLRPTGDGLIYVDRMVEFCPRREPGAPLTQDHFDLAWGIQKFTEEIVLHLAHAAPRAHRPVPARDRRRRRVELRREREDPPRDPVSRALRDAQRQRSRPGGRRSPLRLSRRPRRQGAPSPRSRLPRSDRVRGARSSPRSAPPRTPRSARAKTSRASAPR